MAMALATDDPGPPARGVVGDSRKPWPVELLNKDEKQHLGLGDRRVLWRQAVDRRPHVVDVAYDCLARKWLTPVSWGPTARGAGSGN